MTDKESMQLDIIAAYMGSPLTDEQKEFASDFRQNTASFSCPGSGKTHTLTAGLIMAQKNHGVNGSDINCMSFTNAAVNEIAARYRKLAKTCGISPTVKFNTFHALSRAILVSAYPNMRIMKSGSSKADIEDMTRYLQQEGIPVDEDDVRYVKKYINAVNSLNSALAFHPDNVKQRYKFIELQTPIETFQKIRSLWFGRGRITGAIVEGDIPIYALHALMSRQDLVEMWKHKYEIMIVDEFQDLSLLHLHILAYITKTLVAIGDMKQQIYSFNGSCPQIVEQYLRLFPDAKICNLTKSFRCSQVISDFATRVIRPNDETVNHFSGHTGESNVELVQRRNLDWKKIVENIEKENKELGHLNSMDIMFLYRNNASAIPIIEELYKADIPYRCSKLAKIMDMPVFDTLTKLVLAAQNPKDLQLVDAVLRLFPEFKQSMYGTELTPITQMKSTNQSIFEIKRKWRLESSMEILRAMYQARQTMEAGKSAGVVYMKVLEVYKNYMYKSEAWKIDRDIDFYLNLAAPVCNTKTFPVMYNEEFDKMAKNEKAIKANVGIRCYTMHSAKGLEARDVYILDCDEGMFPNSRVLKNTVDAECIMDAAESIRAERNLLYVAITRAKRNVYISYSGSAPTCLIANPEDNELCQYDDFYQENQEIYDDADEFFKLMKVGDYKLC